MSAPPETTAAYVREMFEGEQSGVGEDRLAQDFTARHADALRYVHGWHRWLRWGGRAWRPDATLEAFDLARAICREAAADDPRQATKYSSAQTVAAVVKLASADRVHARTVDVWDADPWLLGTPGGTVDLRTGELREARRDDCITKLTAVAPRGDCPGWQTFLDRVMGGDSDLCEFLQRMAGYALTGATREHALFFLYGTGGNGKGVFLNTLTGVLGDYSTVASMEAFTNSPGDRHPTDLAMLRGARLVTSQETEEGRRWAESRVKALTGGDAITARFMRADFFTFIPQFKLVIAGNHKPGLRNVDEAIRRRLHLVPFTQTIPAEERDERLPEKLREEWPGILAWAIAGCLDWQAGGLRPPASVQAATEDYLRCEDALGAWLADECTVRPSHEATCKALFTSWKMWAEAAGEHPGSLKRFSQNLVTRGFERARIGHGRDSGFSGLSVQVRRDAEGFPV